MTTQGAETTKPALGATAKDEGGVDFAVYSSTAEAVTVCLFDETDQQTDTFELSKGEGDVWSAHVPEIGPGWHYGYRTDGRYDPLQGFYHDPNKLLVDPYAKRIDRTFVRSPKLRLPRSESVDTASVVPKAIIPAGVREPVELNDTARPGLIYELNVRPYTMRHPSVQGPLRGTVAGLMTRQVIDHIKYLGVDVVELMPVAAWVDDGHLPALGLTNVWGYNPVTYFAPDPRILPRGPQELRAMTDLYREEGIRVVLDVVYNHTGEGNEDGPVLSLKGFDARAYYRHVEIDGRLHLVNDSGTGNTLQCDHPATMDLIIDSLKFWVTEYGVAGFRFDLAPVLGRRMDGFHRDAPLLERMRNDPVLKECLLMAEPWDPGPGGYHVGQFGEPFLEWNDKYRDEIRKFWRGDDHLIGALAGKVAGSADQFNHDGRKPSASVNFLAAHDGFTLLDTVSYNGKHNDANGEDNRDGHDANYSWNNGAEGETDDADILVNRKRDVRAMLATLFLSHGTPMITAGDELGRSQGGNNNAYAQDNEITWLDWENADGELVDFVAALNRFRQEHPALNTDRFLTGEERDGVKDVTWLHPDGREMSEDDWNDAGAGVLGMLLFEAGETMLVWFNRSREAVDATLPEVDVDFSVALVSDGSAVDSPMERVITLPSRSVVVMTGPRDNTDAAPAA